MRKFFRNPSASFDKSSLHDQETFYAAFTKDLGSCKNEMILESPYMTSKRVRLLLPTFCKMLSKGVKITVNTRPPEQHDEYMKVQSQDAINMLLDVGVQVLFTGGHHRKLAIIDRQILWEGSLNILSQRESCEIMRRIDSEALAKQMIRFVGIGKFLN